MYIRGRAQSGKDMFYRFYLEILVILTAVLLMGGSWYGYTSTFDSGTVGLMSVNIAQGERPLFFYGQPYFGALEAYLAALFISLFGFSEFVISLSPISFTLAWVVFTYLLFSRIHNRTAGLVAAEAHGEKCRSKEDPMAIPINIHQQPHQGGIAVRELSWEESGWDELAAAGSQRGQAFPTLVDWRPQNWWEPFWTEA